MNKSKIQKPIYAKKSFGQNFLVDRNYIDKIISALNLQTGETIIEIGAGRGALTEKLIESGANVLAIELDRDLIPLLQSKFGDYENFRLIESDALEIDFQKAVSQEINNQSPDAYSQSKLVANLPYNISTAILQKLTEQRETFSEMILMFQREVVERITAKVGNSERGFLTVLTEAYLEAEKLFDVPPNAFRPVPKVWSSVVRLKPKDKVSIVNQRLFRQIVSLAFMQKRKTIFNNLKNAEFENISKANLDWLEILKAANVESAKRAESLYLEDWENIYFAIENFVTATNKSPKDIK
ncbi:MAG TPA: 16S rRNA (adenine(1518)-N(6)/adenine(1519)-N(6))-dimethyltransferase RsmA [Pyrinomonadaceae bacterium]|jgi:16S rRNA (adenine1518-N6/adenine1519-N6)-dimethyltransferase